MSIYWIDHAKPYAVGRKNVEEILKTGINNKTAESATYSWTALENRRCNESGHGLKIEYGFPWSRTSLIGEDNNSKISVKKS